MLEFTELAGSGRGLEQLVRELLLLRDMHPQWSGVGPDGGRDLLFDEVGLDLLGRKRRRWLVSCKDNSTSGSAVGVDDISGIVETVRQHDAEGFLLVCSTHPSSALVERLTALEANRANGFVTHIWDGATLERLLGTPRTWALAQQFMPVSAQATGWKIFGTSSPNQWVAVHKGHYFHLSSRVGGGDNFDLESLDRRIDEMEAIETGGATFRIRGVWLDDAKGGGYVWYVDYMYPQDSEPPTVRTLQALVHDSVAREDGQFHAFDIERRPIQIYRDHFDIDHYEFYHRLPGYV